MKICDPHWQQLRAAIELSGLSKFVAKNGEVAAQNLTAQLQGTDNKENYDPLMSANFAIWANALECFGPEVMQEDAPCPLCILDHHVEECKDASCQMKQTGADWIGFAVDGQLETAKEMGLIGGAN